MTDKKNKQPHQGLKAIALIKVLRGSIALTVGILLLKLQSVTALKASIHPELEDTTLLLLIDYLEQVDENILLFIGLITITFGLIRYAEAIGLWFEKRWAEWLALLTSLAYIPFELMGLATDFNFKVLIILIVNLVICVYLFRILRLKDE